MHRSLLFTALTLAAPSALAQGADPLTAPRIACTPERVTECKAPNDCKVTPASARDKQELLIIDFGAKTAVISNKGKENRLGTIESDRVEGDVRRFAIRESAAGNEARNFSLTRAGVLTFVEREGRLKSEASCKAAPAAG